MPKRVFVFAFLLTIWVLLGAHRSAAQDDNAPKIDFTFYSNSSVLPRGTVEEWDGAEGIVFAPHVIEHEGTFYMFYSGADNPRGRPAAIGLATSPDGINWTKYADNPILEPDGDGFDSMCISVGVPFLEGDTWVLYYAANSQPCYGPGRFIGRATADSPEGPWQRDAEPLLTAGTDEEWDAGFIMPHSVIKTGEGYRMYYSGGEEYLVPLPRRIGLALSEDGLTWVKCNDPSTTTPCEQSDPLYYTDAEGNSKPLDLWAVDVLPPSATGAPWEMFFSSTCPDRVSENCPAFLGYGLSDDGITWTIYNEPGTRVLEPSCDIEFACQRLSYPSALRIEDEYYIYFTGCTETETDCEIGLATGTISR